MTFGVVVHATVPNERISDPFPWGSWPYHLVPDGQRGICYSSVCFLRCAFLLDWTLLVLAVGSMVPKVTLVHKFRLNSLLYVSRPTLQLGLGLYALSHKHSWVGWAIPSNLWEGAQSRILWSDGDRLHFYDCLPSRCKYWARTIRGAQRKPALLLISQP